ncbi:MAG: PQQ-binding-like beta-propeller repeat protein [Chloroflexi bacterium]|nr:PQQ-binding-like beta-propeller repeat protein [Chloroflexota bacterium]
MHNRTESILSSDNVDQLKEAWRIETGGVTSTPVIVDGVVYFGDWLGFVRAVGADDGTVMWEEQVSQVPISASVAVTDEVVVAGDLAGVLHALGRDTGEQLWSTQVNPLGASLFASPVIIDDSVVLGMTDTELGPDDPEFRASVVAVDIEDGAERWRLHTDPDDGSGTWVSIWSSVAYDPERGLVFVGTGNTNGPAGVEWAETDLPLADGVLAIDHDTGEMAWFFKLIEADQQRDLDVGASPNLFTIGDRDVVGVGGKSGDYVVLDRDTGELVWKTHLTQGSAIGGVMSTAAIGDGVIYVASNASATRDGTIFALEASDGSILWQRRFDPAIVGGSMALANGVLYRGIWNFPDPKGTVVALDADDGTVLWTDTLDRPLGGGFSISAGTLYVGYGSGTGGRYRGSIEGGLIAYTLP